MDLLRQAAQMALEAWDRSRQWPFPTRPDKEFDVLRAALAQTEQEPVAWINEHGHIDRGLDAILEPTGWTPLYTHPPQRKPLTDDQIAEICMDCSLVTPSDIYFARAIEKAHKIE